MGSGAVFGSNGDIKENKFCKKYAENADGSHENGSRRRNSRSRTVQECISSIKALEKLFDQVHTGYERLDELDDVISDLEEEMDTKKLDALLNEDDTEAQANCTECLMLEKMRELNKPTTGQIVGGVLSTVLGAGLSIYGVREARRSQKKANELLAWQGYPAENNAHYALQAATLGFPFISQGIYGLTQGRYNCANSVSPYSSYDSRFSGAFNFGSRYGHEYGPGSRYGPGFNGAFNFGSRYGHEYGPGSRYGHEYGPGSRYGPGFNGAFNFGSRYGHEYGPGSNGAFNFGSRYGHEYGPGSRYGPGFNGAFNFGSRYGHEYGPGSRYGPDGHRYRTSSLIATAAEQRAWLEQQHAFQEDHMRRQQIIVQLSQELARIQTQIQMVANGGGSIYTGLALGLNDGVNPAHNPSSRESIYNSGDLPVEVVR